MATSLVDTWVCTQRMSHQVHWIKWVLLHLVTNFWMRILFLSKISWKCCTNFPPIMYRWGNVDMIFLYTAASHCPSVSLIGPNVPCWVIVGQTRRHLTGPRYNHQPALSTVPVGEQRINNSWLANQIPPSLNVISTVLSDAMHPWPPSH